MLTPYPQIVEYNEAVQHPATAFRDAELRQGQVKANGLGLPVVLSGGFALTYMMTTPQRRLALRCFHREIPAAEQKYAAIAKALKALQSPYFVDFDFVPDGIRIRGGFYPVLKMEWADGAPLGVWLDRFGGDRHALERLREGFAKLADFFEQSGIAHGDIQNGNVIVSRAGLRLVDYDGMYVPGMPTAFGCETGHKHFQHPGRATAHFGPGIDRFSFIAVDLSLAALIEDLSLHRRFRQGGETILFRANDFADPDHSEVFRCLAQQASLRDAAANFAMVCRANVIAVPSLAEFRAGSGIPGAAAAPDAAQGPQQAPTGQRPPAARYMAPYRVLPAEFAAVSPCVGERVELVGQVRAIRAGTGEQGRRRDQPCTVVHFAPPRQDGVTVTLWADEPNRSSDSADQGWIGRWVSIVGLIDPPRIEDHFWRSSTYVGIGSATPGEIDLISEEEARFRLSRSERTAEAAATPASTAARPLAPGANRRIVGGLLRTRDANGASPAAAVPATAQIRTAPPASPQRPSRSNQTIVGALRRTVAKPNSPAPPRPATAAVPPRPASHIVKPAPRVSAPIPKSGSFVIHPRNHQPRPPPPVSPEAEPTAWQRVMRFFGLEA